MEKSKMADRTNTFQERRNQITKEGNPAEIKCEEFYSRNKKHYHFIRYGLDQMSNYDMTWGDWEKIGSFVKKTPDYLIIEKNGDASYLLEAKGCKGKFMLKKEDWEQYDMWDYADLKEATLVFYIYDFSSNTQKHVKMEKLRKLVKSDNYKWVEIDKDTRPKDVMFIPFQEL